MVELARGKVNQVRAQTADWAMGGLLMPETLTRDILNAARTFGHAVAALPDPDATRLADEALVKAHFAAHQLVAAYVAQVFRVRHHRQPRLDTQLGCRLQSAPPADTAAFSQAFNAVAIPLAWSEIEPERGKLSWEAPDMLMGWGGGRGRPEELGWPDR